MAAEASVYRSTNLTVVVDTVTLVEHDTEVFDVGAMHDPVTNPSRLTVPAAEDGYYLVVGQAAWDNAGGQKEYWLYLRKNGVVVARDFITGNVSTGNVFNRVVALLSLAAGDYVDLQVLQSGGTVSSWALIGGLSYTFLQTIKVA